MNKIIIAVIVVLLVGFGVYLFNKSSSETAENTDSEVETTTEAPFPEDTDELEEVLEEDETMTVIGSSVDGRDITAYHYGTGNTELLFVGGIHGGYSWNTALVAYELMDYLEDSPSAIPENVRVTVIPVLNPDGLEKVVGTAGRFTSSAVPASEALTIPGRFNGNTVDLNRNFDCDWQPTGTWQSRSVSGGTAAFSEPESAAIRDYVTSHNLAGVVVWYSAAGGVFASSCHNGVSPETLALTNTYADASGYPAFREFDFYEITGDMVNWLAKEGVPAISVLLTTHSVVEWNKNRAGIDALLQSYAN